MQKCNQSKRTQNFFYNSFTSAYIQMFHEYVLRNIGEKQYMKTIIFYPSFGFVQFSIITHQKSH